MKKIYQGLIFLLFILAISPSNAQAYQNEPTTLIFVRHAERAEDGTRNPPISEEGIIRAVNLYESLSEYDIKAIYSTPYHRTKMTAQPAADSLGLEVQEYGLEGIGDFIDKIISENSGYSVLIVGHSNTTPSLVNMVLGEERFEQIEETKYGDMFVVTTSEKGKGTVLLSEF